MHIEFACLWEGKIVDKHDDTLWSDKIWESVDDSKQDSSEPEVNRQAETNLALKQSSFLQSDLLWITVLFIQFIVLIPLIEATACGGIIFILFLNVFYWIWDEEAPVRKRNKILFLIVVMAGLTYWSWKVFEANCCGFSNFN